MRIGICDDEEIIREDIRNRVLRIVPKATVCIYTSAEELLDDQCPDILLLDIQMYGMSGMEAARIIRKRSTDVVLIFVTAVEEYVFEAFDVGAFHYLVKPFSDARFEEILIKAAEEARVKRRNRTEKKTHYVIIQDGITRISLDTDDIVFAEVLNRTVTIHLKDNDISYRGSIGQLAGQVGTGFYQTHRAFLVNMKYVSSYSSAGIETPRGTVTVARGTFKEFVKAFMEYMRND
ncbi:MAG: LytTR family DNA-binding domain-containing protein [Lachnospiraceae bacterium]|nr:LytTR family DNA-binding domain-containing protein [Lachnospiraceae bacterium]